MRAFTKRLVEMLIDAHRAPGDKPPLTRNRNFHTFETAEGRRALRVSRHLRSVEKDLIAQLAQGLSPRVTCHRNGKELVSVELEYRAVKGRRTAYLTREEFEILLGNKMLHGVLAGAAG
jgi:hypothetical protein